MGLRHYNTSFLHFSWLNCFFCCHCKSLMSSQFKHIILIAFLFKCMFFFLPLSSFKATFTFFYLKKAQNQSENWKKIEFKCCIQRAVTYYLDQINRIKGFEGQRCINCRSTTKIAETAWLIDWCLCNSSKYYIH